MCVYIYINIYIHSTTVRARNKQDAQRRSCDTKNTTHNNAKHSQHTITHNNA